MAPPRLRGVWRAGVTVALHYLEHRGLIRLSRKQIVITERKRFKAAANGSTHEREDGLGASVLEGRRCPLWVISRHRSGDEFRPITAQERTCRLMVARWLSHDAERIGGHRLLGKCDPQKWPEEINRENRDFIPPTLSLSRRIRENDLYLVADFRASPGQSREGQERARNRATGWLCWEAAANASQELTFPDNRENTGNYR